MQMYMLNMQNNMQTWNYSARSIFCIFCIWQYAEYAENVKKYATICRCSILQVSTQNMQNNMQNNSARSIFCIFCTLQYVEYAEYVKNTQEYDNKYAEYAKKYAKK